LEQLDQQESLPETTYTLASAYKIFELTLTSGFIQHQFKTCKWVICLLLCTVIIHAKQTSLTYSGTHHNYPLTITHIVNESSVTANITAIINTTEIQESHTSIIDIKTQQLLSLSQKTVNNIDDEYFSWSAINSKNKLNITFNNDKLSNELNTSIDTMQNPMTLQGLLYLLQHKDLSIGQIIHANLLVPWKSTYPIRIIVKNNETISINNITYDTYKISF